MDCSVCTNIPSLCESYNVHMYWFFKWHAFCLVLYLTFTHPSELSSITHNLIILLPLVLWCLIFIFLFISNFLFYFFINTFLLSSLQLHENKGLVHLIQNHLNDIPEKCVTEWICAENKSVELEHSWAALSMNTSHYFGRLSAWGQERIYHY